MRLITPQPELETTSTARTVAILVRESFMYVWLPMRCSSGRDLTFDPERQTSGVASAESSLRQIVYLQSNRVGSGTFDSVDHLDHFAIVQRSWRLNKYGLFDPVLVFDTRASRFHSLLIATFLRTLLKSVINTLRHIP